MRVRSVWWGLAAAAFLAAGCSGGGRVSEQLADPVALGESKQAIALLRIVPLDPTCTALGVQIGVREGQLYRVVQTLRLAQTAVTFVTEALLAAGEYHVVSLTCFRARSSLVLAEPQGNGLMRRSYASFSVAAGEVVNLGQIRVVPVGRTAGVVNPFHRVSIEVADWPLAEIERFKSQRPKHFAAMRVRLMTADPGAALTPDAVQQKCAEMRRLQAEGKLQNVPAACSGAPAAVTSGGGRRDQKP